MSRFTSYLCTVTLLAFITASIPSLAADGGLSISTLRELFESYITGSDSGVIRLFLIFLLGLLMSLTPCLYPMLPITVGILQTQKQKSLFRSFLAAFSYTCGIATTFALLGLLAASGSTTFGALLGSPWFVGFFCLFLGYLAFSMLGLYEMYIPRFMQGGGAKKVNGSLISAFLFGATSGTVASPCVSPGLFFLLNIVINIGDYFLGFLYLFIFGLGLGFPLLLVGTFSSSLNALPRAGLWMVEVKRFFGLVLLSMCFYYLIPVLSDRVLYLLGTIIMYIVASVFWYAPANNSLLRAYQIGMTLLLAAGGTISAWRSMYPAPRVSLVDQFWRHEYSSALKTAQEEKKLLFMELSADWCSYCAELKRTSTNQIAQNSNKLGIVALDINIDKHPKLPDQYTYLGLPTIFLVDPANVTIVRKWEADELSNFSDSYEQLTTEIRSFTMKD